MDELGNNLFSNLVLYSKNKNCKYQKLEELAKFSQGVQVPIEKQIELYKTGYTRFIRIIDVTQGNIKDIRYINNTSKGKVKENDIFMVRYGSPGIICRNYSGNIANNLFKIDCINENVSKNYLYRYFINKEFQDYIKQNATSSTMPAINFSTLKNIEIIVPNKDDLIKFNQQEEKIRTKQLNIINSNRTLENLRDTLLPKLMNGEIDLDKIEI